MGLISLNEMLEEYMTYEFICASINVNKYYKNFINNGVNIEKDKWINNINNFISYYGEE